MGEIWKPNSTVAAVVKRGDKFLLVEELIDGKLVYNQPAGHIDPGESFIDAVIRETLEETRYPFSPEALLGVYRYFIPELDRTYVRFNFCGTVGEPDDLPLDTEIQRVVWCSIKEMQQLPNLRSPMVMQSVLDYEQGRRFALDLFHPDFL